MQIKKTLLRTKTEKKQNKKNPTTATTNKKKQTTTAAITADTITETSTKTAAATKVIPTNFSEGFFTSILPGCASRIWLVSTIHLSYGMMLFIMIHFFVKIFSFH